MKTPRFPLAWEIWRRNRWGFALLLLLLLVGVANGQWVAALTKEANQRYEPYRPKEGAGVVMVRMGTLTEATPTPAAPAATNRFIAVPARDLRLAMPTGGALTQGAAQTNTQPRQGVRLAYRATATHEDDPVCPTDVAELVAHSVAVRETVVPWCVVLLVFSLLAVCAMFGAAEPHSARGFTGLPPRQFTLPRSTRNLVAWPMGLGVVAILVVYHAWSRLVFEPMRPSGGEGADLFAILFLSQSLDWSRGTPDALLDCYYTCLLPMGLIWFQTLVWGMASFPKGRAWAIVGLMLAWGSIALLPFLDTRAVDTAPWVYATLAGIFVLLALLGARCALSGVARERCGVWQRPERGASGAAVADMWAARPGLGAGFRSPLAAQVWMEWRRNTRFAMGAWLAIACVWVTICVLKLKGEPIALHMRDLDLLFIGVALPWVVISGLNLARDGANGRLVMSSFSATKPMRAGTVLLAKLIAGFALWLAVALPFLAFSMGARLVSSEPGTFAYPEIVVALVAMMHLTAGILPLCLSGRIPGFPWSLLPVCVAYGALNTAGHQIDKLGSDMGLLLVLLGALVAVKIGASLAAFWMSLKRGLLTAKFVLGYGLFWITVTGGLLLFVLRVAPPTEEAWTAVYVACLLALLAVPLTRIAVSPLALSWNRHR